MSHVGVVVIGRNEGERLRRCLQSVVGHGRAVVYVDSGSIDNSLELARSLGVHVLELDCSQPFSAARARNAGFERLMSIAGDVEYVQFVDGDCELIPTWIDQAVDELNRRNDVAVVCGRLRERHPEASIYNRLCDLEWNGQPGEVNECGGIAICRADCFRQTGGFNIQLVAGEEPELCVRLRQCGWRIIRLADDMAYHDANMTRFGQCWKRTVRAGYAFAQGSAMHGQSPQRHWVRESRSNWFWGLVVPLVAGGLAGPTWGFSLLLLLGYPLLSVRIYRRMRGRGLSKSDARLYAMFCVAAKIPLAWGQMLYWKNRLLAKPGKLIEYKTPVELSGQA